MWIVGYEDWQPVDWHDAPPHARAIELAAEDCLSLSEAMAYVEEFNRSMLAAATPLWAVPMPVAVRFEGDAEAGRMIEISATR